MNIPRKSLVMIVWTVNDAKQNGGANDNNAHIGPNGLSFGSYVIYVNENGFDDILVCYILVALLMVLRTLVCF